MSQIKRLQILAAGILIATVYPVVWAAGDPRTAGRFDDYFLAREGGSISVAPRAIEALETTDPVKLGWQDFRARHGANWNVYLDERSGMPTLVSGPGIHWFAEDQELSLDELELRARTFLAQNAALLGAWTPWLVRDDEASNELREGHWKLVFRLQADGVRVENARLDFVVNRGRLVMFGASNWKAPSSSGLPTIEAGRARGILDAYLDGRARQFVAAGDPELTLIAVDAVPQPGNVAWGGPRGEGLSHLLVWRFRLRDPEGPAQWVGEIDANNGKVRAFYDGAHYAGVRGGVFPEQPDGDCNAGGCELDDLPMPFADWTEAGQPAAVADTYGNFTCSDPDAIFETTLTGQYVEIADTCGAITEVAGCTGSVQLGVKPGENCDVVPFGSSGNTAAARSSYYHINRVAEAARYYNPGNTWLQGRVTVNTNWIGLCNASFGGGEVYVYRQGTVGGALTHTGCANTGEIQGIVVHEWGHGYDQNDGGGWDRTSEAYADLVAMFASRQSCFGPGMFQGAVCSGYGDPCFTCSGFRDHDWAARQANTPATPQDFVQNNCGPFNGTGSPCGGEVHCETYPIGEAIFDLATRDLPAAGVDPDSAWQLIERLWYSSRAGSGGDMYTCALPASDSCAVGSLYQQLRNADDDDADLSNGTPHAAALFAAFDRHNIACGSSVDPENQSTTSCPALMPPVLTVTPQPGGTDASWAAVGGASQYVVYRGDLGCQRQQVPVATIAAGSTNWLDTVGDPDVIRYYRVEAVGANPICRSPVSNCEATPMGPRLQKNAHRMIESGFNTNGNGVLDPGETVELPVTLFNGGLADALNVTSRLRTVNPLQGRVVEPIAGWGDIAVDTGLESNVPHFEVALFNSGIDCGDTVEFDLEMNADGTPTRTHRFDFTLGEKDREYYEAANLTMSRFVTTPIVSTMVVTDDTVIGDLDVSVNITHGSPPHLIVELTSPMGTTVRLHDLSTGTGGIDTRYDLLTSPDGPGTMADFVGESLAGTWTLSAQNTVFGGASGTFNNWTLHVTSQGAFGCSELTCMEPAPSQAVDGLLMDKSLDTGDGSLDLVFDWNGIGGSSGYHVLQSVAPVFAGSVDLTGRTTGATTLSIEDGADGSSGLTYFQVRAINGCNEESP